MYFLDPFPIKFLIITLKTNQHWKKRDQRGKGDSFGNGMATVIKWFGHGYFSGHTYGYGYN